MSKVTIAFGSFIIGACLVFNIVPGNASTFAQQVLSAVPVVPSLEPVVTEDSTISGARFLLDGIFARHMNFSNVTIEYGGRAFRLQNCKFDGSIRLELRGAAANTFALVQYLQAIEAGRANPAAPRKPLEQLVDIMQAAMTDDLVSPFGPR